MDDKNKYIAKMCGWVVGGALTLGMITFGGIEIAKYVYNKKNPVVEITPIWKENGLVESKKGENRYFVLNGENLEKVKKSNFRVKCEGVDVDFYLVDNNNDNVTVVLKDEYDSDEIFVCEYENTKIAELNYKAVRVIEFESDIETLFKLRNDLDDYIVQNKITIGEISVGTDIGKFHKRIYDNVLGKYKDKNEFGFNSCFEMGSHIYERKEPNENGALKPVELDKDNWKKVTSLFFKTKKKVDLSKVQNLVLGDDVTIYEDGIEFNNLSFSSPESWFEWERVGSKKTGRIIGINKNVRSDIWLIPVDTKGLSAKDKKSGEWKYAFDSEDIAPEVIWFPDVVDLDTMMLDQEADNKIQNLKYLKYVRLPRRKTREFRSEFFKDNGKLVEVENMEYVMEWGGKVFENTSLKKWVFGNDVNIFNGNMFLGCDKLENIEILNEKYNDLKFDFTNWTFEGTPSSCKVLVRNEDVKKTIETKGGQKQNEIIIDSLLEDEKPSFGFIPKNEKEMFGDLWKRVNDYVIKNKITTGDEILDSDINKWIEKINNDVVAFQLTPKNERLTKYLDKVSYIYKDNSPTFNNDWSVASGIQFSWRNTKINIEKEKVDVTEDVSIKKENMRINNLEFSSPRDWFLWDENNEKKINGFSDKGSMKEIVFIPKDCEVIEEKAFSYDEDNNEIEKIKLDNNGLMKKTEMKALFLNNDYGNANGAFKGRRINYVKFAKNTNTIADSMFENCSNLNNVKWYDNITKIGKLAFVGMNTFMENLMLPKDLREIGFEAFKNTHLNTVVIGDKISKLGQDIFWGAKVKNLYLEMWNLDNFIRDEDFPSNALIGSDNYYVKTDLVASKLKSIGIDEKKIHILENNE